ncbi:hypothetical protein QJQ45_005704 [Haematococcus lacustris]|nr:hypothetical protein QJQ45_005704 [Haematococcus lacustris]
MERLLGTILQARRSSREGQLPTVLFQAKGQQGKGKCEEDVGPTGVGTSQEQSIVEVRSGHVAAARGVHCADVPGGPDGPRATCEELVPDLENPDGPLKRCGGIGTVNRLKSDVHSYCDINQRCNQRHVHNTKDESRQNIELATAAAAAAEAALAAEGAQAALAAKKGAAKKGAAKKGAAKKGTGSKECPIVID